MFSKLGYSCGAVYMQTGRRHQHLVLTRVLTNAERLLHLEAHYVSWHSMDDARLYLGPLPHRKVTPDSNVACGQLFHGSFRLRCLAALFYSWADSLNVVQIVNIPVDEVQ